MLNVRKNNKRMFWNIKDKEFRAVDRKTLMSRPPKTKDREFTVIEAVENEQKFTLYRLEAVNV